MKNWQYDEFKHCGVDYSQTREAEKYDDRHGKFRDFEKEFQSTMVFLGLKETKDKTVIDLGCGTGAMAIFAADLFKKVYAVDISPVMLEKARQKVVAKSNNIEFVNAGFLRYEHKGEPADLVHTKVAFHHLPDFWKQVALLRINGMMKTGGLLYIHDIVFQFDPGNYASKIDSWISGFEKVAGEKFRADVENHIRSEYSTFGWILEGMLKRAGFVMEKYRSEDDFVSEYACRKVTEVPGSEAQRVKAVSGRVGNCEAGTRLE